MTSTTKENEIVIIGMGYVGLTFALFLTGHGKTVFGVEKNLRLAASLKRGVSDISELGLNEILANSVRENRLIINKELNTQVLSRTYVITVGTPLDNNSTNLAQIDDVLKMLRHKISDGDLVILRSTVRLGTSTNFYQELKRLSGKEFYLAMCPERTIEGKALEELQNLPQIISGVNTESLQAADKFFKALGVATVSVENCETAEFIKLISNTYRDLNFAFANEAALIGEVWGIDTWSAIRNSNFNYPRSNIQKPGLTGGPCLEKDPLILASSAGERGVTADISIVSRSINSSIPRLAVGRVKQFATLHRIQVLNILILGLAFKGNPPTADTRGSLAIPLQRIIKDEFPDATIQGWDPEIATSFDFILTSDLEITLSAADLIIIQNNNSKIVQFLKEKGRDLIKQEAIVYDFWSVIIPSDIPVNSHLITLGKGDKIG